MTSRAYIGEACLGHEVPEKNNAGELFEEYLPMTGLFVIVGRPGARKSLLSLYLATCLAVKRRIVALPPTEIVELPLKATDVGFASNRGSTAFILGEGFGSFHLRARAAYDALEDGVEKEELHSVLGHLPVVSVEAKRLSCQQDMGDVLEKAQSHLLELQAFDYSLRMIVIDTFGRTCDIPEENDNGKMREALSWLEEFANRHGYLIVLLTHPPKNSKGPKGAPRGAGEFEAMADVIWYIEKISKTLSRVRIYKGRNGYHEGEAYDFKMHVNGKGAALLPILNEKVKQAAKIASYPDRKPDNLTDNQRRVLLAISELQHGENGVTPEAIFLNLLEKEAERVMAEGSPISHDSLKRQRKRALKDLTHLGWVESYRLKRKQLYRVIDSSPEEITPGSIDRKRFRC